MAKRSPIYVYDGESTNLSTTGLVGDLQPIEATFKEEKNGECEITIRLPYDEYERWKACKVGNIIRCEVPVRVPPVIEDDEYSTSVDVTT